MLDTQRRTEGMVCAKARLRHESMHPAGISPQINLGRRPGRTTVEGSEGEREGH